METFPDRGDQFFGREADVRILKDRAQHPGLTAVVARPLMGKTWTLNEVARRLLEEGRYLVGYHESRAAESSHLLYAVSNLYTRWLTNSTMRDQAISLWKRHEAHLVPRIGQMVGTLFGTLAGKTTTTERVAAAIRTAFDGLAEAQKDLLSGGIQIAPLAYDEALSLTSLVAEISGSRVVLILDAWEKSPSISSEYATLEAFLKHQDDWRHTHVFLAIRNLEFASTKVNDEAYRWAHNLRSLNPASIIYLVLGGDLMQGLLTLQGLQCDLGLELRGMVTTGLAHGSAPHFQVTVRADDHLSYCPGIGVHF